MDIDFKKASHSLIKSINCKYENKRTVTVLCALKKCGTLKLNPKIYSGMINVRKEDGGWVDVDETVHCAKLLKSEIRYSSEYKITRDWIKRNKAEGVAWGHTPRDAPRIMVTGWVLVLLPELADEASLSWLENEWKKDFASDTRLTYKGALTLLAFASTKAVPRDISLIETTVQYLISEQNDDGGFAPWKGHPTGSEPWSTGICLLGLTAFPEKVEPEVLEKTLEWVTANQLPNGLWPCHYIEEGSAYCYWGAVEAMKCLKKMGRL